uniref:Lipase domain-containing protein n=1 Tax=Timema bartmani TaxID=61472 RepID=A0A7R9F587_9NEOP|nr:unnamed protein product [Timema bartmani]
MLNQTNLFLQTMLFVVRNINDGEEVVSTTPESPPDDHDSCQAVSPVSDVTNKNVFGCECPANAPTSLQRLTRCYEPYGCFSTLYPWTDVNRPISNLPEEPYKINTNFCLYTRKNPHTCQVMEYFEALPASSACLDVPVLETNNPISVYRSNLARSDLTYFIAHGYLEGGHKPWIGNMGVRPERIHFIGHSLGAHLGGYVGHNLQRMFHSKLGRITGLDPAEPHFGDTLPVVRLDYTDAEFVDIIHTDTSRFITGGKATPLPTYNPSTHRQPSTHIQHLYPHTTPLPTYNTSTHIQHLYPHTTPLPTYNPSTHIQHLYPHTTPLPTDNPSTHIQPLYPHTTPLPTYNTSTHLQPLYPHTTPLPTYNTSTHIQHLYPPTTPLPTDNPSTHRQPLYPHRKPLPTYNTSTHIQHLYPPTTPLPTYNPSTHIQHLYPHTTPLPTYNPSTHIQPLYPHTTPLPTYNPSTHRQHLYPHTTPLPTYNTSTHRQHLYPHTTPLPTDNTGGLGMREPIGHVDFYPNGGVEQPGCDEGMKDYISMERGSIFGGLRRFLSCNHLRSYEYFIHSINADSGTAFMAAECPSWKEFQNGTCFRCSNDVQTLTGGGYGIKRRSVEVPAVRDQPPLCTKMGFHADAYLKVSFEGRTIHAQPMRKHVQLFLMTGAEKPFWKHHYRVQFQVSCSEESLNHNGEVGIPRIILHGDRGTTESMPLTNRQQYFGPGSMHRMTVAGENVGVIKNVTMEWQYNMSFINILSWRIITSPRIYLSWVSVESLEIGDSLTVCPPEGKPVISGISKKMVHCTKEMVECSEKD